MEIVSLLQNCDLKDAAQNYLKNVHGCVVDLKDAICEAILIIESTYGNKYISREESRKLQKQCGIILEGVYTFKERLAAFSTNILRNTGIMLNPSINHRLQQIILARGAYKHVREPFYTYEARSGEYACAACDVVPNSYQGECLAVRIEYREKDGKVILDSTIHALLSDIELSVKETLSKYHDALEKSLKQRIQDQICQR